MNEVIPKIKLYGTDGCHKTKHYKFFLDESGLPYEYFDVMANKDNAEALRSLYDNRKLNFPTITIGKKKLRNPPKEELEKWLNKLIPSRLIITHEKENNRFILKINGEIAKVEYIIKKGTMYLVHSEVPFNLRGYGIGKVLVEKTFEKLIIEGYNAVALCSYIKAVRNSSDYWKTKIN